MAPHSSTLACKIPWTEEPGRRSPWGHKELDMTEQLHFHFSLSCIGGGNGNPLQCSCLEESQGRGSLVGSHLWGCTESDTTDVTQQQQQQKWLEFAGQSKGKIQLHRKRPPGRSARLWLCTDMSMLERKLLRASDRTIRKQQTQHSRTHTGLGTVHVLTR